MKNYTIKTIDTGYTSYQFAICNKCGVMVADIELHTLFHQQIKDMQDQLYKQR